MLQRDFFYLTRECTISHGWALQRSCARRGKANIAKSSREQIASTGLFAKHLVSVSRGSFQWLPRCVSKQRCFKKDSTRSKISPTPSQNEWEALAEIREEQQEGCGKIVKGTLQIITMHPRGVALFSEDLIRIFHKRAKQDIIYIDATGSVVLGDKRSYAYTVAYAENFHGGVSKCQHFSLHQNRKYHKKKYKTSSNTIHKRCQAVINTYLNACWMSHLTC